MFRQTEKGVHRPGSTKNTVTAAGARPAKKDRRRGTGDIEPKIFPKKKKKKKKKKNKKKKKTTSATRKKSAGNRREITKENTSV